MSDLTTEQVKAYVESGGNSCPYCGSADIEGDRLEADDYGAWQEVRCADCGRKWTDTYKLTGLIEVGE